MGKPGEVLSRGRHDDLDHSGSWVKKGRDLVSESGSNASGSDEGAGSGNGG